MPSKIKQKPQFIHRDYKDNFNAKTPKWYQKLPFGGFFSVMMGGSRTISEASKTYQSYSEGKSCKKIATGLFQTTLGIAALGCSIFVRPLGFLVTSCADLAQNCFKFRKACHKKDVTEIREAKWQILNYFGMFLSARSGGKGGRAILRHMQRQAVRSSAQEEQKALESEIKKYLPKPAE
jgi:hypothetical protein